MIYRALVVEDDSLLVDFYRRVLETLNWDVLTATDGQKALQLLEQTQPHLVFLDVLLPNVNGLRILDYIQSAPHLQHTHVVVVSASSEFAQQVFRVPRTDFWQKPVLAEQIRTITQQIMHGSRT